VARLNADLFLNCLDELSDAEAQQRPDSHTNSIAFIALHVTDRRFFLSRYLKRPTDNPFAELLENARSIDDIRSYPTLDAIRAAWLTVCAYLDACLDDLTENQLCSLSAEKFPVSDPTVLGGITFLLQHESYHIGQMALLRKHLGRGSIGYRRRKG
jgi:uncharacterized damage-inducible protein DinB